MALSQKATTVDVYASFVFTTEAAAVSSESSGEVAASSEASVVDVPAESSMPYHPAGVSSAADRIETSAPSSPAIGTLASSPSAVAPTQYIGAAGAVRWSASMFMVLAAGVFVM